MFGVALLFCCSTTSLAQNELTTLSEWVGKYPVTVKSKPRQSIYNAPALQPRLLKLLGAKYYRRLANRYYVMSPIKTIHGYLIAYMCEQHFCPHNSSFMAVNLSEGDIHVAFFSHGSVEWFHTKGKAKDLPHEVLHFPWWMQAKGAVEKVRETTRGD
jgi:hypothetical protein